MQRSAHIVPAYSILSLLQDCIKKKDLETGRKVSSLITKFGLEKDPFLGTHLIRLFTVGGSLSEAQKAFHHLSEQTQFSWSAIISAHAKLGKETDALNLYAQMRMADVKADAHTFVAVLTACSHVGALQNGKHVHVHATEDGYDSSVFVGNSLISMYVRSGNLDDARILFERLPMRDIVSFSAIISGYTWHGSGEEALRLFVVMQQEGIKPDKIVMSNILNVCASLKALDKGKMIHSLLSDDEDAFLQSALVYMYANCESLIRARELFDRFSAPCVVTWNAMISGYTQHGLGHEALHMFTEMITKGIEQDSVTYLSIVKAGSCLGSLQDAHVIHSHIVECCDGKNVLINNSLIDMYAKCGCLEAALKVFDNIKQRTVVTWNVLIAACFLFGSGQEALHYYQGMLYGGTSPNSGTFISALKASLSLSVNQGRVIHVNIIETNHDKNLVVGNTLIDMYMKCGEVEDACWVFDDMPQRDVVTWTAVIMGLARHNSYDKVKQCFIDMQQHGVKPNSVTFLCLLSGCNQMGLVKEGRKNFKMMKEVYNIAPTLQHYGCMVDLLARGGLSDEAEELLRIMPSESNSIAQTCLLNQCSLQHNVAAGMRCFEQLVS